MGDGTLFVVATPLGHLGDLTHRAADLLRSVPVVAAEDTRRTRILLQHLEARPRLLSYHAHSPRDAARAVLECLRQGDVALVTDAGTPGISDPGAALVDEVRRGGFRVVPLPGASAVTTALSASGLPADRYAFLGFLPRKGAERDRLLARIGGEEWTTVLFEAPGRLDELLSDLARVCGPDRRAVIARELTKVHEEIRSGTLGELVARAEESDQRTRGECTVVVAGSPEAGSLPATALPPEAAAAELLRAGLSRKAAAALLASLLGVPRNEAYRVVMRTPAA